MLPRVSPGLPLKPIDGVRIYDPDLNIDGLSYKVKSKFDSFYSESHETLFFSTATMGFDFLIQSLRLKKGDEILISNFNCRSMVDVILANGLTPILYNIDNDFQCNLDQMDKLITEKTKMIVFTHFFGRESVYIDRLPSFLNKKIFILEDCAHSLFDSSQPRIGKYCDFSIFSFGNDKPYSVGKIGVLRINNKGLDISEYNNLSMRPIGGEVLGFMHAIYFASCGSGSSGASLNALPPKNILYTFFFSIFFFNFIRFSKLADDQLIRLLKFIFMFSNFSLEDFYVFRRLKSIIVRLKVFKLKKITIERANKFSLFVLNLIDITHVDILNHQRSRLCQIYSKNQANFPYLRYPYLCSDRLSYEILKKKFIEAGVEVGTFNWDYLLSDFLPCNGQNTGDGIDVGRLLNIPSHPKISEFWAHKISSMLNNEDFVS